MSTLGYLTPDRFENSQKEFEGYHAELDVGVGRRGWGLAQPVNGEKTRGWSATRPSGMGKKVRRKSTVALTARKDGT